MKAFLVFDEMPPNCGRCTLRQGEICRPERKWLTFPDTKFDRPEWCPLQEPPPQMKAPHSDGYDEKAYMYILGMVDGWNSSLKTLLGDD